MCVLCFLGNAGDERGSALHLSMARTAASAALELRPTANVTHAARGSLDPRGCRYDVVIDAREAPPSSSSSSLFSASSPFGDGDDGCVRIRATCSRESGGGGVFRHVHVLGTVDICVARPASMLDAQETRNNIGATPASCVASSPAAAAAVASLVALAVVEIAQGGDGAAAAFARTSTRITLDDDGTQRTTL